MKHRYLFILSVAVFLLSSCTIFYSKQSPPAPAVSPKPLAMPLGKHWQIVEEPPKLSDETGRLPFQTEQSVRPDVAQPVPPEENRKIETSR